MVLLASSHPVAFVQSKLSQDSKDLASIPEDEPPNPEPATPNPKASAPSATAEPGHAPASTADPVTFEADQEQTINSDTLHALVEQLRPPPSPTPGLEQIVIIRTVDNTEHDAPPQ